jgi:hypothetical protein
LYAYWELHDNKVTEVRARLSHPRPAIRVYHYSSGQEGGPYLSYNDVELTEEARDWYLQVEGADRGYELEIGMKDSTGKFVPLARSNRVFTPRAGVSELVESDWKTITEILELDEEQLAQFMKNRPGSEFLFRLRKRMKEQVSSGALMQSAGKKA